LARQDGLAAGGEGAQRMIAARRIQEALHALGYDLGRWGVDGHMGGDTTAAVVEYQRDHGLQADGLVGSITWAAFEGSLSRLSASTATLSVGSSIVTTAGQHGHPALYSASRSPRPWSQITGVTLHQMACIPTDTPKRMATLNAHIAVLRKGTIVECNDLVDFIWHAQGLSHSTIGIEFSGHGDLTPKQRGAAAVLFSYLRRRFRDAGQQWTRVHAHRQSAESRAGDPGAEIWRDVALPWIDALGASDGGPGWSTGTGRPIPDDWR